MLEAWGASMAVAVAVDAAGSRSGRAQRAQPSQELLGVHMLGWPAQHIDPEAEDTAVGAWCSIGQQSQMRPGRKYCPVRMDEFVEISNGVRVSVRWDRGVTVSWDAENGEADGLSERELLDRLEGALLPGEGEAEDVGALRSGHEYASMFQALGVPVAVEQLRQLP